MLGDVEFFSAKLSKIDGFNDAGDFLANIVKSKEVEVEAPAAAEEPADGGEENGEGEEATSSEESSQEAETT